MNLTASEATKHGLRNTAVTLPGHAGGTNHHHQIYKGMKKRVKRRKIETSIQCNDPDEASPGFSGRENNRRITETS